MARQKVTARVVTKVKVQTEVKRLIRAVKASLKVAVRMKGKIHLRQQALQTQRRMVKISLRAILHLRARVFLLPKSE